MSALDSILDVQLEDLADRPAFVVPPNGAYNAIILSMEEKTIGEHPAIEVKFQFVETLELANEADTPVAAGTESSCAFMLDNEYGVGDFKAFTAPLATALGVTTGRDVVAGAAGMQVMVVVKNRKNKDKTQTYLGIDSIQVL